MTEHSQDQKATLKSIFILTNTQLYQTKTDEWNLTYVSVFLYARLCFVQIIHKCKWYIEFFGVQYHYQEENQEVVSANTGQAAIDCQLYMII